MPVFVIPGSWECSDAGIWDFVIAKDSYARSISMTVDMTFEELIESVTTEFELQEISLRPKLSYWLPSQLSVFSVNSRPPVIVSSNMSVKHFLDVKKTAMELNLFLSLDPAGVDNSVALMRKDCSGPLDKGKGIVDDVQLFGSSGMRRSAMVLAGTNRTEVTPLPGIRRRLFADNAGECSADAVRFCSVESDYLGTSDPVNDFLLSQPDEEQATNDSGLIRLADANTPSLASDGLNSFANMIDEAAAGYEDEAVLREVEEIEKAERLRKGKGLPNAEEESEDTFTDGVLHSGSSDDGLKDSQYWIDLFDEQYPLHWPESVQEMGQLSLGEDPQVGGSSSRPMVIEESTGTSDDDVAVEVLAYVTNGTRNGDERGNSNRDIDLNETESPQLAVSAGDNADTAMNEATEEAAVDNDFPDYTQREDAAAVYDDIYELTNTDGCVTASAEEDAIYIGRVFKDKRVMQNTLAIYAIKRLFHFRQPKSDTSRVIFICADRHCAWRVFARRVSQYSENFEIRTATLTHTCSITARSQYGKLATSKVIGEVLKGRYANGLPGPRAVDIPDIVLAELKVSISYMKAWYAREAAIFQTRGSDKRSYELLAVYMHLMQKSNPGTVYKLEYTTNAKGIKQFKYLFFSLGGCIAGMKFMRKVILIDGTAIKSKFKGVLLTASMQDANFQVFPIAFGIVDSENEPAWTWFMTHLSALAPDAEDLVLVSDRHRSIYAAMMKVYPVAFHGACAVHIERNVRANFPGTAGLSNLVGKAARAFNVGEFDEWYVEIAKRSERCAAYLDAIPREHWTQAYCPAKRYNIMSSNIAEALNGALAKIIELPIVSMVESIRLKLMEWFCIRRAKAERLSALPDPITPNVNKLLLRYQSESAGMCVKGVSAMSFQVNSGEKSYYVDLQKKTCTCLLFQKLELPCCHALASARLKGTYVPSLISSHYTVSVFGNAYAKYIYPVPNQCDEVVPRSVEETQFVPPVNPNGPGRRRKRRIPSTGEYPVCYICIVEKTSFYLLYVIIYSVMFLCCSRSLKRGRVDHISAHNV